MKNIVKSALVAAVLASSANVAMADITAEGVRFTGDTEYAGFCKAVVQDDVRMLRSAVVRNIGLMGSSQREVLRIINNESAVTCNGVSLVEFSESRSASNVYQFLKARS